MRLNPGAIIDIHLLHTPKYKEALCGLYQWINTLNLLVRLSPKQRHDSNVKQLANTVNGPQGKSAWKNSNSPYRHRNSFSLIYSMEQWCTTASCGQNEYYNNKQMPSGLQPSETLYLTGTSDSDRIWLMSCLLHFSSLDHVVWITAQLLQKGWHVAKNKSQNEGFRSPRTGSLGPVATCALITEIPFLRGANLPLSVTLCHCWSWITLL